MNVGVLCPVKADVNMKRMPAVFASVGSGPLNTVLNSYRVQGLASFLTCFCLGRELSGMTDSGIVTYIPDT